MQAAARPRRAPRPSGCASVSTVVGPRPPRRARSNSRSASSRVANPSAYSAGGSIIGCIDGTGIELPNLRQPLGGDPHAKLVAGRIAKLQSRRATGLGELAEPGRPARVPGRFDVGDDAERDQRLVHLVGVARARPGLFANRGDGVGVELAEIVRVGAFRIAVAAVLHRLSPSLLDRRVVEERVRPRAQRLGGERRRRRQVAREHLDRARLDPAQQREPAGSRPSPRRGSRASSARSADARAPRDRRRCSRHRRPDRGRRRRAGLPTSSAAAAARPSCRR